MKGQFLAPSLAIHLHQFGFSPTYIGLAFAVPGIVFAVLAPMIHKLTAIAPKRAVIIFGCLLTSLGMFFVGTSKSFGLDNNPELILLGMTILGGAAAVMTIPVLPEMMEAVQDDLNEKNPVQVMKVEDLSPRFKRQHTIDELFTQKTR